jgi:hypothetical protein
LSDDWRRGEAPDEWNELRWYRWRRSLWDTATFAEAEGFLQEPQGGPNFGHRKRPIATDAATGRNERTSADYDPRSEFDPPERPRVDSDKHYQRWDPLNLNPVDNSVTGSGAMHLRAAFPTGGWRATLGTRSDYRGRYRGYADSDADVKDLYRKSGGRAVIRCAYCGATVRSRALQTLLKWWRVHC